MPEPSGILLSFGCLNQRCSWCNQKIWRAKQSNKPQQNVINATELPLMSHKKMQMTLSAQTNKNAFQRTSSMADVSVNKVHHYNDFLPSRDFYAAVSRILAGLAGR
jgi:hypothetical protein